MRHASQDSAGVAAFEVRRLLDMILQRTFVFFEAARHRYILMLLDKCDVRNETWDGQRRTRAHT